MSDLHVRGCDCELCLPGHRAQMTRVYSTVGRTNEAATRRRELFPAQYEQEWLDRDIAQPGPLWLRALERRGSAA